MSELIISVSGLRGIVGQQLTPEVAVRYASAFASQLLPGRIVVTRDGRATGRMIVDAVRSTLCAMGRNVIDADVAATPTTGVLVRHHRAAGGLQISASHNPAPYNGMKLFGGDGRVIPATAGEQVLQAYHASRRQWVSHDQVGQVQLLEDTSSAHQKLVLANVQVQRIRDRRFSVLLDSNHGAGSVLGKRLLECLGCHVTALGDAPDGDFSHTPEPTAENLKTVCTDVVAASAAVGFCQDPDADRLALIDERGRYVGEEFTLAVCLDHVLRQTPGTVVTNCSTSRMSQDLAKKYGVPFFHSRVGEANVADRMQEQHAVFGGEGNGGPMDPRVGYVRDSFVGMALVLDAMSARSLPLSALVDELPQYAIHKAKVEIARDQIDEGLIALERHFSDAATDRMDGLRLDWPGSWLLVRASNTEPIVRVIAEAHSAKEAQQLCAETSQVLERFGGDG